MVITDGRHPLQELILEQNQSFIPNDVICHETAERIHILTGPNDKSKQNSKSVFIKQVGLIVFLAQIGSFVPARSAVIGVVDRLFTRIRTIESIAHCKSSFAADMAQLSSSIQDCTSRSLLLIDEFGQGTLALGTNQLVISWRRGETTNNIARCLMLGCLFVFCPFHADGVSLLASAVRHLDALADQCPAAFFTTHFAEIQRIINPTTVTLVVFRAMQVVFEEQSSTLTFLFKVGPNSATSSFGTACALQAGVPEPIVNRATEVLKMLERGESVTGKTTAQGSEEASVRRDRLLRLFHTFDCEHGDVRGLLGELCE